MNLRRALFAATVAPAARPSAKSSVWPPTFAAAAPSAMMTAATRATAGAASAIRAAKTSADAKRGFNQKRTVEKILFAVHCRRRRGTVRCSERAGTIFAAFARTFAASREKTGSADKQREGECAGCHEVQQDAFGEKKMPQRNKAKELQRRPPLAKTLKLSWVFAVNSGHGRLLA